MGPMMVLEYMPLGSLYDLLHNESMVLEAGTCDWSLGLLDN